MKVIIAGSRRIPSLGLNKFKDWEVFEKRKPILTKIKELLFEKFPDITEDVCGMCWGVDMAGKEVCDFFGIKVAEFPADWNKYGKASGNIRNKEMGDYGDALLCLKAPQSNGSQHMIDYMKELGKPYYVHEF